MVNFQKAINLVIAFCVFVIFITFARHLVLPHMKVGIPALPPNEIMESGWNSALNASLQFVGYAMIFFFILWVLYQILRKIPLIGKLIIKALGFIFNPCRSSGIFGLFDMIVGTVFSRMTLPERGSRIVRGLMDFSKNTVGFLINSAGDVVPNIDLSGKGKKKRKNDELDKKITNSDNEYINNEYNMCLQENLLEIVPDMTSDDKSFAIVKNQTTKTICKTKQLQAIMDNIVMKI